jgi:linoleate 10R-lipoxygenase
MLLGMLVVLASTIVNFWYVFPYHDLLRLTHVQLEKVLVLMSRLPPDSEFARRLQQYVIGILYKDLAHPNLSQLKVPPAESVAPVRNSLKYFHRTADGSGYNQLFPSMGKAGNPYARSVPSLSTNMNSRLPDPGIVFDSLLKRDKFVPHPGGISSLFFAFANLVIHSIFKTNHMDWTINDSSSYLDLSILYGSSEQQVDSVRRKDGYGKLWDDVFADNRLLFMPPSVGALLVIFNRNHNVSFCMF